MNFDDLVRQADPARDGTAGPGPGLLDRVLDAGPARRATGTRTALLAGVVTAAVTVSVVVGVSLVRPDTAPTPPTQQPVDCQSLVRGWRPTYLPPGFTADDSEARTGPNHRGQVWAKDSARQPRSTVSVSLDA